jgi:hypothetical protein
MQPHQHPTQWPAQHQAPPPARSSDDGPWNALLVVVMLITLGNLFLTIILLRAVDEVLSFGGLTDGLF